jgi:hypothetical protein
MPENKFHTHTEQQADKKTKGSGLNGSKHFLKISHAHFLAYLSIVNILLIQYCIASVFRTVSEKTNMIIFTSQLTDYIEQNLY